ncbi:hypothetical protein [Streptomyces sp. NPDC056817]|uniref:hypothetical protein n=1 Tax=Streptomyces sp. NPDC056817 TaxID=3345950 RepID=UPI00369C8090
MFGRKRDNEAMDGREVVARRLQQAGRSVAGERGSRVANRISDAIGCGRIELCGDPNCPNCGPVD